MAHENLWAPWRMEYLRQLSNADAAAEVESSSPVCFLCQALEARPGSELAAARLVLVNDDRGLVMLNRFPYTNGHLLVAPREHLGDLPDLTPAQRAGMIELTTLAEQLLRAAINPQGINIGLNLGRCAGAGLPGHLHIHLVPRWNGDTNFMQTVAQVRVIPQALEQSYLHLRATLEKLQEG